MKIVSVQEMRRVEALAMAGGISGFELMRRAGLGAADEIVCFLQTRPRRLWQRMIVLAGKGNNGGDAWVVARELHRRGLAVELYSSCRREELPADARLHASLLPVAVPVHEAVSSLPAAALQPGCFLVDGLLGTGLHGAPREPYAGIIEAVRRSGLPVAALDLPSGLDGDSGVGEHALRADVTLTMAFPKTGLVQQDGPMLCGVIRVIDIGLSPAHLAATQASGWAFTADDAAGYLPRRDPGAHKNSVGHLLCVAGSRLYAGAAALCASAALRSGAGLVTLACPAGMARPPLPAALICLPLGDERRDQIITDAVIPELREALVHKHALVYGPGTGPQPSARVLEALFAAGLPMVLDADGLRLLAAHPELLAVVRAPLVLTPHPGEMVVLLQGLGLAAALAASRIEQAAVLAATCRAVVVLKGQQTVVAAHAEQGPTLNLSGNAGLATAGTGDVLAGMIGGLLAQGLPAAAAARTAVFVHGYCAECFAGAQRALIADDLLGLMGRAMLEISPGA